MRRISLLLVGLGVAGCGGSDSGTTGTTPGTTQPAASAPAIGLSAAAGTFSATAGGASPAAQSVTVSNAGTGTLSGLATGTIVYGGPTGGWLAATLSGATAPATLTLTPSTGSLLAGTYTATVPVAATVSGITNSPQSVTLTLTVAPGQPAKLIFIGQPTSTSGTISPAVTVAIEDPLGDIVTTATTNVTIAIGTNSGAATLGGTTTVAAVSGIASFSGLTLNKVGAGYTLVASAAGLSSGTSTTFTVASAVASTTLGSAGQSTSFLTTPNFSTTLAVQPGSQYLVAVVNTDALESQTESFSLTGSFTTSAAAQRIPGSISLQPTAPRRQNPTGGTSAYTLRPRKLPSLDVLRGAMQNHSAVLEQNRQIYSQFGNPSAAWAREKSQGARPANISASISQTVGTVSKVYVLNRIGGNCTTVDSIGARTVAVGQHIIVLADTNRTTWPQLYRPDTSFYQTFANEYDQITWPHLISNIGNPLAYDASLSNLGKVTVTMTPVLNNFGGIAGGGVIVAFVNSCDFYPLVASGNNADLSNKTEMFYSLVPSANGYDVPTWEDELRATAAHETKHIVSFASRIMNNSPSLELIWLEEGLAQESSEIWERNFNSATFLGNAGFLQTTACEYTIGGATCANANNASDKPFALMGSHLPYFFQYLQDETSNSEGLGLDTPANYGAGWTISRWATDQYANGSEGGFIKSLISEPTLTGLNNLSQHTGQSIPLLLVYWNLATAIFQTPTYTAADVRITVPSFNFANIDSISQTLSCNNGTVRCGIFTNSGSPTYPLAPTAIAATGTFNKIVNSVPGTSASYFVLSASTAGIESLQLLSSSGAALSSSSGFRVAIVRVQ